jgi:predicted P-loop ATPase
MQRDLTDWLWALAWSHFKPSAIEGLDNSPEWTTTEDSRCQFVGSDEERIAIARRMKSMAARLAPGRITFEDLWTANADKLSRVWPGNNGKPYDASSADQSLFNSLMYVFGNNCERVRNVALTHPDCALRREKWDRPDYLGRTILKAAAIPKRWTARTAIAAASTPGHAAPTPPIARQPIPAPQPQAPVQTAGPSTLVAPPPPATPLVPVPALPSMTTDSKGRYESTLDTVRRILETDGLLSFDDFRSEPMMLRGVVPMPMTDKDYIDLRTMFEREKSFASVGKDLMRDAVLAEAQRRRFDSGIEWLDSLTWDGVPRVDTFMSTHFGAADDEYTRAVGRYMWTGLAGRMFEPGCQLDMVIALQSKQGTGKSTGLKALAPNPDWFTDGLSLHEDNDNFKRLMRGKVIVEIAEMAGLSKGDINVVKRCITRTTEKWIEKYQTAETVYNRRCMLFASTNEQEFLPPDETGQRRWLPVIITEINRELVTADRTQLWAEGAAIWRESGIAYAEAERLAAGRHKRHEQTDVWETRISEWLVTTPPTGQPPYLRPLTASEVLEGALRMQAAHMDGKAEKRAARVLRTLGYANKLTKIGGLMVRRWMLDVPAPPTI